MANGAYFTGQGDYIDIFSPSNRAKWKAAGMYDTPEAFFDKAVTAVEDEVLKVLEPTAGRWVGWVEGHHWFNHLDGTTTGQRFARELGGTYLGDCGFVRIDFRKPRSGRSTHTKIIIHHGQGSASSGLLAARKYELQARSFNAQLFFIGHHHNSFVYRFPMLDITDTGQPHLYHVTRAIVLTGSFMRGYMEGSRLGDRPAGGYVEKAFMPPRRPRRTSRNPYTQNCACRGRAGKSCGRAGVHVSWYN